MTTKVFVHGNPEVDAIWTLLVAELRARGVDDIVLLSPPGFGAPTPDGWAGDMAAYRDWLVGELERIGRSGQGIDLVGHDWGAGHVFGAVAERPDLVRSFAADCGGLIHPDYVWHDMAQIWQTPGAGEEMVAGMVETPLPDLQAFFESLGAPSDIAHTMAEGATEDMARCILTLYRDAAQPAASELGERLAAATRPPALFIVPSDDPYVSAELAVEMATRSAPSSSPSRDAGTGGCSRSRASRPTGSWRSGRVSTETVRSGSGPKRTERSGVGGDRRDVDGLAALALAERDRTVDEAEQRVVLALTDVLARMELGATLTDEDGAGGDVGSGEHLDAQALGIGITTVAGRTATFGL